VGAWQAKRRGIRPAVALTFASPAIALAQAIGRIGNWFNQELFGGPTTLPWGLEIDAAHLPPGYAAGTLFHPTFLYEIVWNLAAAAVLVWLDRRFRLGHGRVFWLYVMLYTAGRFWIELVRIDPATQVLGLRLNVWTSIVVFAGALVAFLVLARRSPGRDESVWLPGRGPEEEPAEDAAGAAPAEAGRGPGDPATRDVTPEATPQRPAGGERGSAD
jgi:prolipoprotein diacylglyceryl transferase